MEERAGGSFLILLAVFIVCFVSISSHRAESKIVQETISEGRSYEEEQVLGETDDIFPEGIAVGSEAKNQIPQEASAASEETVKAAADVSDVSVLDELKGHLKKYCDKNFNAKKCRNYLLEAKEASKKDTRFKELYKKYHFEKKEKKKSADKISVTEDEKNKASLSVTSGGSSKSYGISVPSGISVIGLMDILQTDSSQNFSYHSSSGFVDKINGTESQGDMSWMLYACKGGTCKLSDVGAADCKIDGWDKVEWRYLDWTTVDWATW